MSSITRAALALCLLLPAAQSSCTDSDWKTTCRMARDIDSFVDLQTVTTLNGVPMTELEKRSRPVKAGEGNIALQVDECIQECESFISGAGVGPMVGSFSGYIAKNETLRGVMERDWELVHDTLHTTHMELAGHIKALLGTADCNKSPYMAQCNVTYDTSKLSGNTIHQATPQRISIGKMTTNGCQCSLFWQVNATNNPLNDGWACTYSLTNLETNTTIPTFGTNCDTPQNGTISWIEAFGFYEGAVPYRIAPDTLYSLFSGRKLA